MNVFIWAYSVGGSNNAAIAEAILGEHSERGDKVDTLVAMDLSFDEGTLEAYREKIKKADLIYFVYPIHWGSYPWKYKQTIDTLLSYGFAYEFAKDGTTPVPLLTKKRARVITTSGHDTQEYVKQLESIHYLAQKTVLGFIGMEYEGALNLGGRRRDAGDTLDVSAVKLFINNKYSEV